MVTKPFAPVPNTIQLRAIYSTPGGYAENVYHVQGSGPVTDVPAFANRALDSLVGWEGGHAQNQRGGAVTMVQAIAIDLGSATGLKITRNVSIQGGKGGNFLPLNVTLAVKWTTDRRGRSYRGRTFHIGLTDQHVAGQNVSPGSAAELITCYQALLAALNAGLLSGQVGTSGTMVVVSRRQNKGDLDTGICTPITGVSLTDTVVDSMRRRLPAHKIYR